MDLIPKIRPPEETSRPWPLGLEPRDIRETLANLPVGRKAETHEELDAVGQWMRVRDYLLELVAERERQQ